MRLGYLALGVLLAISSVSHAVVIANSSSQLYDRQQALNEGYDCISLFGKWNGFAAIPIAPDVFITAKHVGGEVNKTQFSLNGVAYGVDNSSPIAGTDLILYHTTSTMTSWATLYNTDANGSENGKEAFFAGYGGPKGAAYGNGGAWNWTSQISTLSWGTDTIDRKTYDNKLGTFLTFQWDNDLNNTHEGSYTGGDSGGGLFVRGDNGQWQLAGIAYGVGNGDSSDYYYTYNTDTGAYTNVGTRVAVLDGNLADLYVKIGGSYFTADGQYGFASSISASLNAIMTGISKISTAQIPEPASITLLLAGTSLLLTKRRNAA